MTTQPALIAELPPETQARVDKARRAVHRLPHGCVTQSDAGVVLSAATEQLGYELAWHGFDAESFISYLREGAQRTRNGDWP